MMLDDGPESIVELNESGRFSTAQRLAPGGRAGGGFLCRVPQMSESAW